MRAELSSRVFGVAEFGWVRGERGKGGEGARTIAPPPRRPPTRIFVGSRSRLRARGHGQPRTRTPSQTGSRPHHTTLRRRRAESAAQKTRYVARASAVQRARVSSCAPVGLVNDFDAARHFRPPHGVLRHLHHFHPDVLTHGAHPLHRLRPGARTGTRRSASARAQRQRPGGSECACVRPSP